jgi:predicted nucleic acid-binding protein
MSPARDYDANALLDANVILRYVTQDNADQSWRAHALFQQLEAGGLSLTTTESVLVEVVQVLSSRALYNLSRDEVRTHLSAVLALRGLKLPYKRVYLRALEVYVAYPRLDFVDALNVAHAERAKTMTIVSFDRDYDRVPGINRTEP